MCGHVDDDVNSVRKFPDPCQFCKYARFGAPDSLYPLTKVDAVTKDIVAVFIAHYGGELVCATMLHKAWREFQFHGLSSLQRPLHRIVASGFACRTAQIEPGLNLYLQNLRNICGSHGVSCWLSRRRNLGRAPRNASTRHEQASICVDSVLHEFSSSQRSSSQKSGQDAACGHHAPCRRESAPQRGQHSPEPGSRR